MDMKIDLKKKTGSIRLGSMHSMIMGNKPEKITPDMMSGKFSKENHEFEKFGLFDAATPNYTTYYPDVTPEDLKPTDAEFIFPIFRALSATVVWKGFKPIDFSQGDVLKSAMNLLIGQTINADHETALGNAMGSVRSVFWQEAYTKDGTKVPPGINAEFMIDGKSNPRIARGIQMNPPSIHSNSVSVRFEWKPSHQLKSDEDFFNKLGTKDDKGNLYRLVVTKIIQFSETSLVSHGADAFAQKIGEDGYIVNPTYAAGVYNFSSDEKENPHDKNFSHLLDYKNLATLSFDNTAIPDNLNNNNLEKQKEMELIAKIETALGLDAGSITEDNVSVKIAEVLTAAKTKANPKELADLKKEVEDLTGEKETLTADLEAAEAFKDKAAKFDVSLTAQRESAKALYTKLKGDNADEAILKMLDTQEVESLTALTKSYQSDLDAKFPTKCGKCGSTELSKGSAKVGEDDGEEDLSPKVRSNEEARAILRKKKAEKK